MTPSDPVEESSPSRISFPAPTVTPVSRYFWDSAREHRLVFQRCARCGSAVFPPRAHCVHCWATALGWYESSGRGVLVSTAVVHRPGHPAFVPLVPYPLVLVDLDEGFRMLSRIVHNADADTSAGVRLRVWWDHGDEVTLPLFVGDDGGMGE